MFSTENGTRTVCQMGCYGIGVSRIIAAIVEMLAKDGEIRWPKSIAPYSVYVIAPKARKSVHYVVIVSSLCKRINHFVVRADGEQRGKRCVNGPLFRTPYWRNAAFLQRCPLRRQTIPHHRQEANGSQENGLSLYHCRR
jgi:hypothetical protein